MGDDELPPYLRKLSGFIRREFPLERSLAYVVCVAEIDTGDSYIFSNFDGGKELAEQLRRIANRVSEDA